MDCGGRRGNIRRLTGYDRDDEMETAWPGILGGGNKELTGSEGNSAVPVTRRTTAFGGE